MIIYIYPKPITFLILILNTNEVNISLNHVIIASIKNTKLDT